MHHIQRGTPADNHEMFLDSRIRRFFQNPYLILSPYIRKGMSVIEVGCGPGFFTIDIAKLAGSNGHVTAIDIREEMLDHVEKKIRYTPYRSIITLHQCEPETLSSEGTYDFAILFYTLHAVSDPMKLICELRSLLKPGANLLLVEPKLHVGRESFSESENLLSGCGFSVIEKPSIFMSRSILAANAA